MPNDRSPGDELIEDDPGTVKSDTSTVSGVELFVAKALRNPIDVAAARNPKLVAIVTAVGEVSATVKRPEVMFGVTLYVPVYVQGVQGSVVDLYESPGADGDDYRSVGISGRKCLRQHHFIVAGSGRIGLDAHRIRLAAARLRRERLAWNRRGPQIVGHKSVRV